MLTLAYNGQTENVSSKDNIETIKKKFNIVDRKNIYKVNLDGELVKLTDINFKNEVKENVSIEALSDFTLG